MKPPESSHLRSSLVKIGVVVGLDETTPLRQIDQSADLNDLDHASVRYEEQLLFAVASHVAAVTAGEALATSSDGDGSSAGRAAGGVSESSGNGVEPGRRDGAPPCFSSVYCKAAVTVPPVTQCWIRPDTCPSVRQASADRPAMPIEWDIIRTLGIFCCPDGVQLSKVNRDPHCHSLVLTDLTGLRTYGSCLTFYRPFRLRRVATSCALSPAVGGQDSRASPYCLLPSAANDSSARDPVYYIPTCVCLVSEHPYHTVLKACLSSLLPSLLSAKSSRDLMVCLSSFLAHASLVPIPPPGPLSISFCTSGVHQRCEPPQDPGRPVIDMRLHYPFLFFDKRSVLQLITCLLAEQRIIFISSSPSACVMVIECLLAYILPFVWRQHYVPILPSRLIGLTEVPGQSLMGVHPDLVDEIESEDIVFANLDLGTVSVPDSISLPTMPEVAGDGFLQKIQERSWEFDRLGDRPAYGSFKEEKEARDKHQQMVNTQVKDACFQLLAQLFAPMEDFITSDARSSRFNKSQFIKRFPESEQAFYRTVCNTTMFSFFQEDRTSRREDVFWRDITTWRIQARASVYGGRRASPRAPQRDEQGTYSPQLGRGASLTPQHLSIRRSNPAAEVAETLALPMFDSTRHANASQYHTACIDLVTSKLDQLASCNSPNLVSAYRYIRGLLYDACGLVLEALTDFDEISATSVFPKSIARTLFAQLDDAGKEAFLASHRSFERKIKGSVPERTVTERSTGAVDHSKFMILMKENGLLDNSEAAGNLFRILQGRPGHLLTPDTVDSMCSEWQDLTEGINLNEACTPVDAIEVDLYTSPTVVRSSVGVGRLVLTTRSVKILINERRHLLADLQNISRVEKFRLRERLSILTVNALRFIRKGQEVAQAPYVCLREDRDLWHDILTEMHEGMKCSTVNKNSQIIKLAAQNVLVYLTLLRLRYPASAESGLPLERTARGMLCYTVLRLPPISEDIAKALMQRFNPSEQGATSVTVESLEYVPSLWNYSGDHGGRLWCGLGTNCAVVLHAETFQIEFDVRCEGRVTSLLRVGTNVWIGSSDKITVVDSENGQALCTFVEHRNMVTALVQGCNNLVWSGSVTGQIIGWDPQRLVAVHRVTLPERDSLVNCLLVHNGWIWISGPDSVILINETNLEERRVIALEQNLRISCMALSSSGQVWVGGSRSDNVYVIDGATHEKADPVVLTSHAAGGSGVYTLLAVGDKMWAGRKNGYVDIWDARRGGQLIKEVKAHTDGVRSMCLKDNFVVTGPGSKDGVVAIWDPAVLHR